MFICSGISYAVVSQFYELKRDILSHFSIYRIIWSTSLKVDFSIFFLFRNWSCWQACVLCDICPSRSADRVVFWRVFRTPFAGPPTPTMQRKTTGVLGNLRSWMKSVYMASFAGCEYVPHRSHYVNNGLGHLMKCNLSLFISTAGACSQGLILFFLFFFHSFYLNLSNLLYRTYLSLSLAQYIISKTGPWRIRRGAAGRNRAWLP